MTNFVSTDVRSLRGAAVSPVKKVSSDTTAASEPREAESRKTEVKQTTTSKQGDKKSTDVPIMSKSCLIL